MTDHDAILAEIDELAGVPERQVGDVSVDELVELWGITSASARLRIERLVEQGQFVTLVVYDPKKRRQCRVWRKVG